VAISPGCHRARPPIMGQNVRRSPTMNPAFLPRALTAVFATLAAISPLRGQTLDKVSFGTNWVAEAEHGGFSQAVADGTYRQYGFNERMVRPYTFNSQPFLANRQSAMQGYVTSEPYAIERVTGKKPGVTLLAVYGFNAYSTLIETRLEIIDKKPDLVQRFVDA